MAAMQINNTQFQQWMQEGKTVVMNHWAPWCGYAVGDVRTKPPKS